MEGGQECLRLQPPAVMIANREAFPSLLAPSDLVYNLADEKFLPELAETVTRKRKERLDSGSSSVQERKVIRSNSEERTVENRQEADGAETKLLDHISASPDDEPPVIDDQYESFYKSDSADKHSHAFEQSVDSERSSKEFLCFRQKYSKNDSSPSRSRIHEYILFPKRISPNRDPNAIGGGFRGFRENFASDERDHERARCSERRSRTLAPRTRRGPRRQSKQKPDDRDSTKENDSERSIRSSSKKSESSTSSNVLKENSSIQRSSECPNPDEDGAQSPLVRSVSPTKKTPMIDLTMLHEQLGQNEPVPSVPTKLMGFPWDPETSRALDAEPVRDEYVTGYDNKDISNIRDQRRTLPDKCDDKTVEIAGAYVSVEPDERLNKIAKKLQFLKKKIAKCEAEFEAAHGFRASQADKMGDEVLRKLYADVRRLKIEKKSIKAGPGESLSRPVPTQTVSGESLKNKPMTEIMTEIEKRLDSKRVTHSRPDKLDDCTYEQLAEEKTAVQRALLWLEGARGRPSAKEDRDAARPLYDRYRAVKRLVARYEAIRANSSVGELATIMEHETMLFTNDSPLESPEANDKPSQSDSAPSTADVSEKKDSEEPTSSSAKSTASDDTNAIAEDSEKISNENLHCLPLKDLNILLIETKNLKTALRRNIKLSESEFEVQNSRKMLKDERQTLLPSYAKYKETKARLRLLNALVSKQKKAYG